jgi:hypothetical protein
MHLKVEMYLTSKWSPGTAVHFNGETPTFLKEEVKLYELKSWPYLYLLKLLFKCITNSYFLNHGIVKFSKVSVCSLQKIPFPLLSGWFHFDIIPCPETIQDQLRFHSSSDDEPSKSALVKFLLVVGYLSMCSSRLPQTEAHFNSPCLCSITCLPSRSVTVLSLPFLLQPKPNETDP